uniref:Histone domain-containing protein n=1 Tax=Meloidogyne hapla TaxID=6305 RepID=A0A1I8BXA4_MELHA
MEDKANSFNHSTSDNSLEQQQQLESQLAEITKENQDLKKCQQVLCSIDSKNIFNAQQDVYSSTYPKNWPFQIFTPYSGLRRSSRLSKPIDSTNSLNISLDLSTKEEYLQTNKFIESNDLKENLDYLKVLLEIRKYQKTTRHLIPRSPFSNIFKEILQNVSKPGSNLNVELKAIDALHEESEAFITQVFEAAHRNAIHAKRETIKPEDFYLARWMINTFGTTILR